MNFTSQPVHLSRDSKSHERNPSIISYGIQNSVNSMKTKFLNWLPFRWRCGTGKVFLLGRMYDLDDISDRDEFVRDYSSRIQFTYRRDFDPIFINSESPCTSATITSDSGWGCMIRVSQMCLANTLLSIQSLPVCENNSFHMDAFIRSRLPTRDLYTISQRVLSLFEDKSGAPFSLHSIVEEGRKAGRRPGIWFGPTSAGKALSNLIEQNLSDLSSLSRSDGNLENNYINKNTGYNLEDLGVVGSLCFDEGTIYENEVIEMLNKRIKKSQKNDSIPNLSVTGVETKGILLFVSTRLFLNQLQVETLKPQIKSLFSLPFFCGLLSGGATSSAHYFVAAGDQQLFFLDPHVDVLKPLLNVKETFEKAATEAVSGGSESMELILQTQQEPPSSSCSDCSENHDHEINRNSNFSLDANNSPCNCTDTKNDTANHRHRNQTNIVSFPPSTSSPRPTLSQNEVLYKFTKDSKVLKDLSPLNSPSTSSITPPHSSSSLHNCLSSLGLLQLTPLQLSWSSLNPSMCSAFYLRGHGDWEALKSFINGKVGGVFSVEKEKIDFEALLKKRYATATTNKGECTNDGEYTSNSDAGHSGEDEELVL